jgi:hypothetical protein
MAQNWRAPDDPAALDYANISLTGELGLPGGHAPAIRDGLVRVSGIDPKGVELAYGRGIFEVSSGPQRTPRPILPRGHPRLHYSRFSCTRADARGVK